MTDRWPHMMKADTNSVRAIACGTGAFVNQARAGLGPNGLQSPIATRGGNLEHCN